MTSRAQRLKSLVNDRRRLAARWRTNEGKQLRDQLVVRLRAGEKVTAETEVRDAVRALSGGYSGHQDLDLRRVDLSAQSLDGVDLSNADLQGANLSRCSLVGANLSGANLREVFLRKANLSGANLASADLDRAVLEDVRLDGALLDATRVTEDTRIVRTDLLHVTVRRHSSWSHDASE